MPTLYEIGQKLAYIREALMDPELGGDERMRIEAYLYGSQDALEDKVGNYLGLIREMEAQAAAKKAEAERLRKIAEVEARGADRLKERLLWWMRTEGHDEIRTPKGNAKVVGCGGQLPVVIEDEAKLPPEYLKAGKPTIDKTLIREHLTGGVEVPGCKLGERPVRLRF